VKTSRNERRFLAGDEVLGERDEGDGGGQREHGDELPHAPEPVVRRREHAIEQTAGRERDDEEQHRRGERRERQRDPDPRRRAIRQVRERAQREEVDRRVDERQEAVMTQREADQRPVVLQLVGVREVVQPLDVAVADDPGARPLVEEVARERVALVVGRPAEVRRHAEDEPDDRGAQHDRQHGPGNTHVPCANAAASTGSNARGGNDGCQGTPDRECAVVSGTSPT
jgi:hypothetical protein